MSVHQEAWESLRAEMVKEPTEEWEGIEIVGIMSVHLARARKRAKEYQKKLKKEIDYESIGGH